MMGDDRELLELAAKAARVGPILCYEARRNCLRVGNRNIYSLWRPLTDDGDALRLAVKLSLEVFVDEGTGTYASESNSHIEWFEKYQGDMYATTRLAIVRAAAEIGRAMP